MLIIRPETEQDYRSVFMVHSAAFGRENEARLVDELRSSADHLAELSLVATFDERVVGHILFPPIRIETGRCSIPALALAPVAVLSEYQNQGIGSQLIERGLETCRQLGHKVVVVVGHPDYYPRFGFTPARACGLQSPFPVPDEAFLVWRSSPDDPLPAGTVCYPAAFGGV